MQIRCFDASSPEFPPRFRENCNDEIDRTRAGRCNRELLAAERLIRLKAGFPPFALLFVFDTSCRPFRESVLWVRVILGRPTTSPCPAGCALLFVYALGEAAFHFPERPSSLHALTTWCVLM